MDNNININIVYHGKYNMNIKMTSIKYIYIYI